MADNFVITQGTGTTISADDVGSGVLVQRVKPVFGADGFSTDPSDSAPFPTKTLPMTSGGLSIYRNLDLDETGVNVKSSAGQLYGYHVMNAAASARYVKFYDKASAPTVGTDTPVITIQIPAGGERTFDSSIGLPFATGIGAGATTGTADADTGAPAANDCVVNLFYK